MSHQGVVLVPVHNEREALREFLTELTAALAQDSRRSWQVFVIDDCSNDGTEQMLPELAVSLGFNLIRNPVVMGYGASLKRGLRHTTAPIVGIIDADGTYPTDTMGIFADQLAHVDMVVGARCGAARHVPFLRRPAKYMLGILAQVLSGQKIPDVNSGLRVMKRDVIEKFVHLCPGGFSFTTTITLALHTNDYAVQYETIDYKARKGTSKIRPVRDTLNFAILMIRITLYFQPLRVFVPLCLAVFSAACCKLFFDITGKLSFQCSESNISDSSVLLVGVCLMLGALGGLADAVSKHLR